MEHVDIDRKKTHTETPNITEICTEMWGKEGKAMDEGVINIGHGWY